MSGLTKRDAQQLVAKIRSAHVGAHATGARIGGGSSTTMAAYLGGLESVIQYFLRDQGCHEAAAALPAAMNDVPTEAEVDAYNAESAAILARVRGSAA